MMTGTPARDRSGWWRFGKFSHMEWQILLATGMPTVTLSRFLSVFCFENFHNFFFLALFIYVYISFCFGCHKNGFCLWCFTSLTMCSELFVSGLLGWLAIV